MAQATHQNPLHAAARRRSPRTPLILGAFTLGTAVFVGLKWRAVLARSEAAKLAGSKEGNYAVVPGRSGGGI